ncbi:hypothetical protein Tco_0389922 [Tanacetum coccineum]
MSFRKRADIVPVCYTKPPDSLKHCNDSFFWVDSFVFPLSIPWHTKKTLTRDPSPTAAEFSAKACDFLTTHQAIFWKFPKPFLCLVGISRYYDLDDNVYPTFLTATGEEMDLFDFIHHVDPTKLRIGERQIEEGQVPLLKSTKGRVIPFTGGNEQGDQNDNVEDAGSHNLNEEGGNAEQENHFEGDDRVGQDDNIVVDDDVQAAVADKPKGTRKKRKDAGGVSATTVPFVTSSVTLTPEHEGGGHIDSVSGPNLQTQYPAGRSLIPPPLVMTAVVATTTVIGTSYAPVLEAGTESAIQILFADSASPCTARPDTGGPSNPRGTEISADTFYVYQEMDSETLQQIYVPQWNMINDSTLDDPETDLLKEKDVDIASLKAQLSLKEAEDAELLRLKKSTLEGQVMALESATVIKDTELASFNAQITKLTQDLLNFQLSYDELSIKAASLESEGDGLVDQVSSLEGTCFGLRDQVSSYELFKEQCEAIQDAQVKILSDRVAKLDSELMDMVVHLDEEFYPRFLTTIAGLCCCLGTAIGLAIDKGMQTGLVAGIDHKKAERGLVEVAAYDPSVEERYVSAILTFCGLDFNFLSQLESRKDANIADIMNSLRLEDTFAENPEVSQLQHVYEQLLLPIHQKEENAVIEKTSLSDSLNVVHDRVQKVKPVGEASTSGVLATATTTTALSVSVTTANVSSIPPISRLLRLHRSTLRPVESAIAAVLPTCKIRFYLFYRGRVLWKFQVRGRSFPLRSLSLYAPLPSASVTSYGPSHLGPSFPSSSAWLASLLWYTRSPSLCCGLWSYSVFPSLPCFLPRGLLLVPFFL